MKRHPLPAFFIFSFAITWGLGALFFLFASRFEPLFGEPDLGKPFYKAWFHLAVYGPALSAFVVIAMTHGAGGVRAYARRLLHWRVSIQWYAGVVLGVPIIHICSRLIYTAVGGSAQPYPFDPWYMVIPGALLGLVSDPGPMEELGWRGFALPHLQRRLSALWASVVLGVIWGVWHLPAFYISAAPQSAFSFPFFLLGSVSYSIVMTALYNGTGGSIPLAFLFHWQINNAFGLGIYPKGEWITPLLFAFVAIILAVILGPRNLGREKYTEAVPFPRTTD